MGITCKPIGELKSRMQKLQNVLDKEKKEIKVSKKFVKRDRKESED